MPHRICPQCERPGRLLEAASHAAWVDYYRCDACGHVWTQDKKDLNAPPCDVTVPRAAATYRRERWLP
jgi:uncharacterized Zn finger protein